MFSDPIKNVEQLGPKPGSIVADFGSGSGHYALASAKAVGDSGRVYAIDIQKDMLTRLKTEALKQGLTNVEVIWGDIEKQGGTKLGDGVADVAVISNLLFQVSDKVAVAQEAQRVLKSHGTLLLVDWSDSIGGLGPATDAIVSKDKAISLFNQAGFSLDREINAGDHHYGLIFVRA